MLLFYSDEAANNQVFLYLFRSVTIVLRIFFTDRPNGMKTSSYNVIAAFTFYSFGTSTFKYRGLTVDI